jgi:hypothetical protein
MPRQEIHPRIGQCNIIIEAEMNFKSGKKFFALISSYNAPKYAKTSWGRFENVKPECYEHKKVWGKKSTLHHYILWGNSADFSQMGITQCLTDGLRANKGSVPINKFFEIIHSSENMTFKK